MQIVKMRYSIEPRDIIYVIHVKGYGFLSFAKNMGKSLSNKYGQKRFDSAKKSTTDVIKTALKKTVQKTTEATGDLIVNKIADKTKSVSKKSTKKLPNEETEADRYSSKYAREASLKDVPKKRCISVEERQQIIDVLRLV